MSMLYRFEVEVGPVDPRWGDEEIDEVRGLLPFETVLGADFRGDHTSGFSLAMAGEDVVSGGPDAAHAAVVDALAPRGFARVVTRWRCVEFDGWDDTFGEGGEDDE